MPYGDTDQPGVFTPYNVLFATQGIWRHTVGMTGEFYGDRAIGTKARALRSLGRYASGRPLDQQTTRRLAGVNWSGRQYAKIRDSVPGLGNIAANLSYLGPSRYLTLWAGLAGHQGAGAGLAAMQAVSDVAGTARYMQGGLDVFSRAGGKAMFEGIPGYDFRAAKVTGAEFFESYVGSSVEAQRLGTWGEYVRSDSRARTTIAELQRRVLAGDATAGRRLTAITGGTGPGTGLYKAWGGFLTNKIAGGSAFWTGMGRAMPSVARLGTAGFMGVDLYTLGVMGAGLMGKAALASMKAPITTYNAMTSDIHRGTFMSSSPLSPFVGATQRQRAMANIYDRQLNLRQVLGNEAAYFSRL
jgi:hypothetical protein